MTRILIIQGHPERGGRFCHALADAYAAGAEAGGHTVKRLEVARLDFPTLRSQSEFENQPPPPEIASAQADIAWAQHIALFYPLWLGTMPALLKGFLEQTLRPGFAFDAKGGLRFGKRLKRRSAHIVVTMGMPGPVYRWFYGAHSLKNLKRNILGFCGISPCRDTLIGMVEKESGGRHERWLQRLHQLGQRAK